MDPKELRGLYEAYSEVYAPQEVDEAIYSEKGKAKAAEMIAKRSTPSGRAKAGKGANVSQIRQIRGSGRGDFDREGLGGTPMTPTMAKNPIKKQSYTGTGNKAARRAGLTPTREKPNAWKEELDIFDVVLEFLQAEGFAETLEEAEWMMANVIDEEAIDIILGEAKVDAGLSPLQKIRKRNKAYSIPGEPAGQQTSNRRAERSSTRGQKKERGAKSAFGTMRHVGGPYKEEYVGEAQEARNNPEKYEREQSKKYAPVRGEKTPMPPRGNKRREDFEKWYAKQMGR